MIKLALSDLDDTLIPFGSPHISRHALDAIHAMLDQGLRFGPATGRTPWDLGWMFADDAAAFATSVTVNGQLVRIDGELVREVDLDADGLVRLCSILSRAGGAVLALNDHGTRLLLGSDDSELRRLEAEMGHDARVVSRLPARPMVKANIHVAGGPERLVEMRGMLREELPCFDFVLPNPKAQLIDVLPRGWGKHRGVDVLRRELGLAREEVVAFGDAENDLAVLRSLPNSVSVANAVPEVSAATRWHIGACADDAVADALFDIAAAATTGGMPAFMREGNRNPDATFEPVGD